MSSTVVREIRAACLLLLLVTGVVVASAALAESPQRSVESRLQIAVQKLESGDSIGALLDLETVLSRDDEYWPAYYWRGRVQAQMGDDLGAKESFLRAADLDPGNAELHFLAASVAWQLADFTAAWGHVIAAAQAGYPELEVQALMKSLRQYEGQPADLQARLGAPRIVVDGTPVAPVSPRLLLRVRAMLARSPEVALVQAPELAALVVRIVADEVADRESTGALGALSLVLIRARDGEELLRMAISDGDAGEPLLEDARVAIAEIVGR